MNNKILVLCLIIITSISLRAMAGNDWKTDFKAATNAAAANKLAIFAYFSASDTSEDCMRFDFLVLRQPEFQKYVGSNFILFQADLPRKKSLPDEIIKQNSELRKIYGINRYPTVLLLNSEGKAFATIYHDGKSTASQFIETLRKLIGK